MRCQDSFRSPSDYSRTSEKTRSSSLSFFGRAALNLALLAISAVKYDSETPCEPRNGQRKSSAHRLHASRRAPLAATSALQPSPALRDAWLTHLNILLIHQRTRCYIALAPAAYSTAKGSVPGASFTVAACRRGYGEVR